MHTAISHLQDLPAQTTADPRHQTTYVCVVSFKTLLPVLLVQPVLHKRLLSDHTCLISAFVIFATFMLLCSSAWVKRISSCMKLQFSSRELQIPDRVRLSVLRISILRISSFESWIFSPKFIILGKKFSDQKKIFPQGTG